MGQRQRGDGQHAETVDADEKRELVGAVQSAAVFHHAQVPGGNLVSDAVVEQNDAVGHVFRQPVAGQLPLPALSGDDRRHAFVLEPAKESTQLGAQNGLVGQAGEKHLERIEHDALGADGIDRMVEPDEQSLQIIHAARLDLAALDMHVIESDFFAPNQAGKVEPERGDVGDQFRLRFLESEHHARFIEMHRAAHEELGGEQRLTTAGTAAHQRGSSSGPPAAGDFVETLNARGTLGQRDGLGGFFPAGDFHEVGGLEPVFKSRIVILSGAKDPVG